MRSSTGCHLPTSEVYASALKELKRQWSPVTDRLRSLQTLAIRRVTANRDLGLTSLLIMLLPWADTSYPYGLVRGMPAVSTAPPHGIFPPQPGRTITMDEVLEG